MKPSTSAKASAPMVLTMYKTSMLTTARFKQWVARFHGVATHNLPNYLGWRWAFEQHREITSETLLSAALGNFQYLTVT